MEEAAIESSLLPDIVVQCGPLPPGATSFSTPRILVEVMSDGSVGRDRVGKWHVCQQLPSLQHSVLVESLDAVFDLSALDVTIPLAEIYRDVLSA